MGIQAVITALAGRLDQMIHRGPFQPLPFCDSVITGVTKQEQSIKGSI